MRAACIVPISGLPLVEDFTYHLALVHLATIVPVLAEFYQNKEFVILDNSAHELGTALAGEILTEAAGKIQPKVLVAPDTLWDAEKNLKMIKDFEPEAMELRKLLPDIQFMGVPHGTEEDELQENLDALLEIEYLNFVGLSKAFPRYGLNRGVAAERVVATGRKVHFLGIWADPIAEVFEGKGVEGVIGIDSSYATRLGIAGRTLLECHPIPKALEFFLHAEELNWDWTQRQIKAYRYLIESDISSVAELHQEYKNGRF